MKVLSLSLLILLISCGKVQEQNSSSKQNVKSLYQATELKVNVYYETGAQPYTSDLPILSNWTILEKNLEALFNKRTNPPQILVPKTLTEMNEISPSGDLSWTINDVLNLSKKVGNSSSNDFQIFFLNGYSSDGSSVIGFQITNSRVIAIFKEVIRNMAQGEAQAVPRYVEQATLVHEMGHALGLVNNGVPMFESHQDAEHGAHCSNPDCVMYYSNEGTADLIKFARQAAANLSVVMFDVKCLNDTNSY